MERLWAPWRMRYIANANAGTGGGCVFCEAPAGDDDRARLIVRRGERVFTIMNLFPYTNGHLLIVPYRHVADLNDLDDAERLELFSGAADAVAVLRSVMNCNGHNVGMNLGRAAGAGIADHLHMHVVPRWNGDTNYMAVLDDTRVISEALEETYGKLVEGYRALGSGG